MACCVTECRYSEIEIDTDWKSYTEAYSNRVFAGSL
jgi:hypothetical protein